MKAVNMSELLSKKREILSIISKLENKVNRYIDKAFDSSLSQAEQDKWHDKALKFEQDIEQKLSYYYEAHKQVCEKIKINKG